MFRCEQSKHEPASRIIVAAQYRAGGRTSKQRPKTIRHSALDRATNRSLLNGFGCVFSTIYDHTAETTSSEFFRRASMDVFK